jgi:hypothetical protein
MISQVAWSQEVTANITGTVTDPSGAPVMGATATATDVQRGTTFSAVSNNVGIYNISRIPIGQYAIKVQQKGFETAVQQPVNLDLNQTARLDFQLKVGQVSEVVEVSGVSPLLQTQSTEVSTLIDANTQVSLPLGTRDYLALTLLAPGATTPDATLFSTPGLITSSGRPYINGNREQANAILLDGIDASENNNNEVGYTPSPDAIQEFNLITQNASAEFGSYEGGVISTSIKSGTNNYHGSIFEFYRDGNFNANSWANGLTQGTCGGNLPACNPLTQEANGVTRKPGLVWNQFGGSVGGPIIKNKLFFFADYEGQRFDTPPSATPIFVLHNSERSGDFGDLCGTGFTAGICNPPSGPNDTRPHVQLVNPNTGANVPNNNLAAAGLKENAVTAALFNAIPQGDAAGNLGALNGQQINNDQGDLKIDYNVSDKDHTFVRWTQAHIRNPFSSTFALSEIAPATEPVRNLGAQWVHTINSNLLNDVHFGFNAVDFNNPKNVAGSVGNLAQQIGIAGGNAFLAGLPSITAGPFTVGSNGLFQDFHTTTGQIDDNLSITRGRHQFKVGFQYQRLRLDNVYSGNAGELGSITFGGGQTGSPLADLWLGDASNASRGAVPPLFGRRANVYGAFVQDDWRITNTVTLNLGIRFEDHTPFNEIHNQEVNFAGGGLIAGGLQVEQGNNTLYNNYTGIGDFLPRIGASWAPEFLHNKTVFRAGYAISEYTEGGGVGEQLTANFPFTAASFNGNFTNPNGNFGNVFNNAQVTQPCPTITLSCYKGVGSIFMFDPNFRPALAQQWNLTIQHQINNATTAQIGYVGQHGTHLYNFMEYNQAPLLDSSGKVITQPGVLGTAGKPFYLSGNPTLLSDISFARGNASNGSQRYDALQAVLQHRMSNGLDAQVAYTYSKCLSDSGGFYGTWGSGAQTSHGQVGWTNIYNPRMDWGPCFFDQTHLLSSYVTYQLPVGRGKKFGNSMSRALDAVVGGWEIGGIVTLHSGNALSDFVGWGGDSVAGATTGASELFGGDRSNCNGPVRYPKKVVPTTVTVTNGVTSVTQGYLQYFDPSTFAPLTTGPGGQTSFGTCSQGDIRGPRFANVDMSLHKEIPISENKRFEFRAEAYNALNHPIFSRPDYNFGDTGPGGFGAITTSQGGRQFQLGVKFYF